MALVSQQSLPVATCCSQVACLCSGNFCGLLLLCQDKFTAFPHSCLPVLAVKTTCFSSDVLFH